MANSFLKPTVVVDTAIKLLQREIVLPQLVWLNGLGDFSGKYQDTITSASPPVPSLTAAPSAVPERPVTSSLRI